MTFWHLKFTVCYLCLVTVITHDLVDTTPNTSSDMKGDDHLQAITRCAIGNRNWRANICVRSSRCCLYEQELVCTVTVFFIEISLRSQEPSLRYVYCESMSTCVLKYFEYAAVDGTSILSLTRSVATRFHLLSYLDCGIKCLRLKQYMFSRNNISQSELPCHGAPYYPAWLGILS